MALPTSYMTGGYTKIPQYFDTLLTARAPEKFTNKFMADLGFTSSTDRLFANVLKSIGFLDDSGVPTERYFKFLDQSCSKQMVAEGVKEAYVDLFNLNVSANTMTQAEVEGKFKTLTNGSKAAATITQMAKTFTALCGYADWSATPALCQRSGGTSQVYGVGASNQLLHDLEEGKAAALAVQSDYDAGYLSLLSVIAQLEGERQENRVLESYVATAENMFTDPMDQILFPIG